MNFIIEEENKPATRGIRCNHCELCGAWFNSIADEWYEKCVPCMMAEVEEENQERQTNQWRKDYEQKNR